jgi:hypothetical protein
MENSKHWRAILIEPLEERVSVVLIIKKGDYHARMSQILGYTERDHVYAPGMEHVFIVDDMALRKPDVNERGFFQPSFFYQPICGNALLFGLTVPEGDLTDCTMSLQDVRAAISFPKVRFIGFTESEGEEEHPILGKMHRVDIKANFVPVAENHSRSTH